MNLVFAYERLDGQYAVCQANDCTDTCNTLEESNRIQINNTTKYVITIVDKEKWERLDSPPKAKDARTYSYSAVHFFEYEGEAWVSLTNPQDNMRIEMPLNFFHKKIVGVKDSITIGDGRAKFSGYQRFDHVARHDSSCRLSKKTLNQISFQILGRIGCVDSLYQCNRFFVPNQYGR